MRQSTTLEKIHVWDRFVRAFHWALVICILLNFFVLEEGETPHRWLGYLATALVCARIVWGFVGSRYARFSDFFPTPAKIVRHVQNVRSGTHDDYPGHNPVAALMIFALMGLVLALGITGYMQGTDAYWGEDWVARANRDLDDAEATLRRFRAKKYLIDADPGWHDAGEPSCGVAGSIAD